MTLTTANAQRGHRTGGVRRLRRLRAFTLPELMVALVAGLIITMAVVGLARTATNTFYEQVRTTTAEMSLRIASQRLAADLSRAGYMSTGNIRWDPAIARPREAPTPGADSGSRYPELKDFAGLRLYTTQGDPAKASVLPLETSNGLTPQALEIGGNFTSNDQYLGTIGAGSACGDQRMALNNDDPAVLRLLYDPTGVTALPEADAALIIQSIFLPVAGKSFPARVTDPSGKTHFVVVCGAGMAAGQAWVEFSKASSGSPVLTGAETGQRGGFEGFDQLQIAPLMVVRWNIQRVPNALLDPPADADAKYDLFRSVLDVKGDAVATELIAEYAIDLKFAFTVDDPAVATRITNFDFDQEQLNTTWTTAVSGAANATPGPQRIRSVRFRVATRAALPDRKQDMAGPAAGYLYRYCIDGVPATCKRLARVRTIVSEVALMNQARMTY